MKNKELDFKKVIAIRIYEGIVVDHQMDYSYWQVQVQTTDHYNWERVCVVESKAEALLTASALKFEIGRDLVIYDEHGREV